MIVVDQSYWLRYYLHHYDIPQQHLSYLPTNLASFSIMKIFYYAQIAFGDVGLNYLRHDG